jgi:hypothetical protein
MGQGLFDRLCRIVIVLQLPLEIAVIGGHIEMAVSREVEE